MKFLNIDIEGDTYKILSGADFTTRLIGIENIQEEILSLIQAKDTIREFNMEELGGGLDRRLKDSLFQMSAKLKLLGEDYVQIP
ncbi:hypothetical protein LCGC14_0405430 [marine sediment metagenome]|uniref:Uncharacterized protein n=1 Tax=marine sediment metagenome TaxID=412755 RepID=A0A0F9T160_9ZZZZ